MSSDPLAILDKELVAAHERKRHAEIEIALLERMRPIWVRLAQEGDSERVVYEKACRVGTEL